MASIDPNSALTTAGASSVNNTLTLMTTMSLPGQWWDNFMGTVLPVQDSRQIFEALNKAIQQFPVDQYRVDPFFLKIWLAFLEAHLYG